MKNLIYYFPLVFVLLIISCSKEDQPQFATVSQMTFITLLDKQGNNLLNPSQEGYYDPQNIKIFYERNGRLEEFYQDHLDMPRNFRIDPPEFERDYIMALVLDSKKTVIRWNDNESDTIRAEFMDGGIPNAIVTKVYFNGELKWDGFTSMTGRGFTIIK